MIWQTKKVKIDELKVWEDNPRTITEENLEDVKDSLKEDGDWGVIVVDLDGTVISGNQRLKSLREMGEQEIDVKMPDRKLTLKERRRIALRANKTKGDFNTDILKFWDKGDLRAGWLTSTEIDRLISIAEDDFNAQEEYEKIKEPTAKRGDIYKLGNHRIMCGDSTSTDDFKKLMNGKLANLIFTDPPYAVDYHSPAGMTYGSKKYGGGGNTIFNDKKSEKEATDFFKKTLKVLYEYSTENCPIYWWFANKNNYINRIAFQETDWYMSQIIIWVKNSMIFSHGQDYHRQYEPCMFGWKKGCKHFVNKQIANYKDVFNLDYDNFKEAIGEYMDVWYQQRDVTTKHLHPTQKPVRLAERAIKKNSDENGIVLDAFLGSGSTLLACEQMNRICYGMELDPKFVDVIIKRWERFTGKIAYK